MADLGYWEVTNGVCDFLNMFRERELSDHRLIFEFISLEKRNEKKTKIKRKKIRKKIKEKKIMNY